MKKKSVKPKKYEYQVNIRNIMLTKESYKQCKKIKVDLWGNLANAIEGGNWYIPSNTHEYADLKHDMEKSMCSFFNIKKEKLLVEIQYFESDILSFEKGVHPNYNNGKRLDMKKKTNIQKKRMI